MWARMGLAVVLVVASASAQAADQTKPVRAAFGQFTAALHRQDGVAAARLLSPDSVRWYFSMKEAALVAPKETLQKLPLADLVLVLEARVKVPAATLDPMTGEQFFAWAANAGLVYNQRVYGQAKMGPVTVAGDTASGVLRLPGEAPTAAAGELNTLAFVRGAKGWLVDTALLGKLSSLNLRGVVGPSKLDADTLPLALVGAALNTKVGPELWAPLLHE